MHVVYLLSHQNEDFKMSNKKEFFKEFFSSWKFVKKEKIDTVLCRLSYPYDLSKETMIRFSTQD